MLPTRGSAPVLYTYGRDAGEPVASRYEGRVSSRTDPNGQHEPGQRGNGHAALPEQVLLAHAQTRELRERPGELVRSLNSYVSYELRRRVNLGQIDYEDLLRDEVIDSAFAAALSRLDQGEP